MKISNRTGNILMLIVGAVWAINNVSAIVVSGYNPSESVNSAFLAVIAYLFAVKEKKDESKDKKGEDKKGDDDSGD